jgi:hypothetical protein
MVFLSPGKCSAIIVTSYRLSSNLSAVERPITPVGKDLSVAHGSTAQDNLPAPRTITWAMGSLVEVKFMTQCVRDLGSFHFNCIYVFVVIDLRCVGSYMHGSADYNTPLSRSTASLADPHDDWYPYPPCLIWAR